ncbi:hypothetical protein FOA43_001095 [Brettanomyces nanus]|uniref:Uncharacterized protein n=1 Tax=Eeniella nana TaxID=13502 RepID=A0A875RWS0_EENNA|nr:uncharacterized protein FOA43_001095 [Brettanomyces nanus]QPG73781.1 hypothetical protein FOA43_001095 [Brettanomyces nanus]
MPNKEQQLNGATGFSTSTPISGSPRKEEPQSETPALPALPALPTPATPATPATPPSSTPYTTRLRNWMGIYNMTEDKLLGLLETLITQFDNFVLIQTFIPRLRQDPHTKLGRTINFILKQLSKFYLIVIAINLRKLLVRLIRVNKLIKRIELECRILRSSMPFADTQFKIPRQLKSGLMELYTVKVKTVVELIGFLNELLLNLDLLWKKFRIPKRTKQIMSVLGWLIGIYRLSKDDDEEEKTNLKLKQMEKNYL